MVHKPPLVQTEFLGKQQNISQELGSANLHYLAISIKPFEPQRRRLAKRLTNVMNKTNI